MVDSVNTHKFASKLICVPFNIWVMCHCLFDVQSAVHMVSLFCAKMSNGHTESRPTQINIMKNSKQVLFTFIDDGS